MTPEQLEQFRIKAQLEALRIVVRGLYTGLANSSAGGPSAAREQFSSLRKAHSKIVLTGINPAQSDMLAAESQSALEDLLSFIEGLRS